MLDGAPLMAMVPVVDMGRARGFYEGKLGLTLKRSNAQGNFMYACGGTTVALYWFNDTEGNILCVHEDLPAPGR